MQSSIAMYSASAGPLFRIGYVQCPIKEHNYYDGTTARVSGKVGNDYGPTIALLPIRYQCATARKGWKRGCELRENQILDKSISMDTGKLVVCEVEKNIGQSVCPMNLGG